MPQTGLGEQEGEQEEQAEDSPLPHPQECRRQSGEGLHRAAETTLGLHAKKGTDLRFGSEKNCPFYLTT